MCLGQSAASTVNITKFTTVVRMTFIQHIVSSGRKDTLY